MSRLHRALCIALCAISSRLGAQGVSGKWTVWDSDIRLDHDTAVVNSRRPATLELTQRGDSIFGTWSSGGLETTALRGTIDGRGFKLTSGVIERMGRSTESPRR